MVGFAWAELAAGLAFNLSNAARADRLDHELDTDPVGFAHAERKKLHRIRDLYQPALLSLEAAVAVGGGVTAVAGSAKHNDTVLGLGLGLAIQGLVLFLLDWSVLDRARPYAAALDLFLP